jgi:hypothetical protein
MPPDFLNPDEGEESALLAAPLIEVLCPVDDLQHGSGKLVGAGETILKLDPNAIQIGSGGNRLEELIAGPRRSREFSFPQRSEHAARLSDQRQVCGSW